ncbi:MAG: Guanine nucleotide exchange factor lte1 [Chrysothrix sp. TS-e1954]|nr:MAG: Guanine nucleotide exchange factor lte1 [Chrysothrix sp. TS-e1954]
MLYLRPVKRETQATSNGNASNAIAPGQRLNSSQLEDHDDRPRPSLESRSETGHSSRSSPKPQILDTLLLPADVQPSSDHDNMRVQVLSNEGIGEPPQVSDVTFGKSSGDMQMTQTVRPTTKQAKSEDPLASRTYGLQASQTLQSPNAAVLQTRSGHSRTPTTTASQSDAPSRRGNHSQYAHKANRPSQELASSPQSQQSSLLRVPSARYLAQRKTVSSETLSRDSILSGRLNPARLSNTLGRNSSRANIRFSPTSGQLLAASPSQLILQITSPNLLDYELLSDFFLTFRVFLTPQELATRLVDRLRWAVNSSEESARIIRVRTFVAMRHWILNYFVDDFVADFDLRCQFCNLVNGLCNELRHSETETGGNLKILGELKKCWRRTCALYWDVPTHPFVESAEKDIQPGGLIGSRKVDLDESWKDSRMKRNTSSPPVSPFEAPRPSLDTQASNVGRSFYQFATDQLRPITTRSMIAPRQTSTLQRDSDQSSHILSCSGSTRAVTSAAKSLVRFESTAAVGSAHGRVRASQLPPSSFKSKRHQHKRSGSFSDALRDDRVPLSTPKVKPTDEQLVHAMNIPGSLIRGAFLRPTAPYVDTVAPSSPLDEDSTFDFSVMDEQDEDDSDESSSPVTTPSVRRFLGSVRRAWSTRQASSPHTTDKPESHDLDESCTSNPPVSGRAPSRRGHGAPKRKLVAGRIQPRVDFLSAETSEAFAKAVRDAEAINKQPERLYIQQPVNLEAAPELLSPEAPPGRPPEISRTHSNVTTGSRSIMIMDDTGTHNSPEMDQGEFESEQTTQLTFRSREENPESLSAKAVRLGSEGTGASFADEESSLRSLDQSSKHASSGGLRVGGPLRSAKSLSFSNFSDKLGVGSTDVDGELGTLENASNQKSFADTSALSEASNDSTEDPFHLERLPAKHLRRRPGGDLRKADRVDDLNDGLRGNSISSERFEELHMARFSMRASSAVTKQSKKAAMIPEAFEGDQSTTESRPSKPFFRPSMELAAAKLAELPDDPEQDGIASALSRLEGRDKSNDVPMFSFDPTSTTSMHPPPSNPEETLAALTGEATKRQHRQSGVIQDAHLESPSSKVKHDPNGIAVQKSWSQAQPRILVEAKAISVTESESSSHSVPLLQRGASHPPKRKGVKAQRPRNANKGLETEDPARPPTRHGHQDTRSAETLRNHGKTPSGRIKRANARESFLLDDGESLSSLSSVTPDNYSDDLSATHGGGAPTDEDQAQARIERDFSHSGFDFFGHKRADTNGMHTSENTLYNPHGAHEQDMIEPKLLASRAPSWFVQSIPDAAHATAPVAIHLPFILGYDSLLLAQQFTLIEKDALSEIEWRDLIDLRWKQSSPYVRNWVDFLKSNASNKTGQPIRGGIDLCIARFNLMSRWTLSEIVLTQDASERAACIVKYIHVAQHTRRLRNWATMYQITMALVRSDCSRLKQTWALVPDPERDVLKALEKLIMPTRNFHNLRMEMESMTSDGESHNESGCIPFIGIYTHDLVYNAQKPAYVQSQPGDMESKLINFDRHHTAAAIVKNLLRLIEASSRYAFQPVPEVASRCLWTAALSDEEITARSRELEP